MKKSLILSGVVLMISSTFTVASGHDGNKRTFEKLDMNSDGVITRNEANTKMAKYFTRFDLDKNGAITKTEFKNRGHKRTKYKNDRRQNSKTKFSY